MEIFVVTFLPLTFNNVCCVCCAVHFRWKRLQPLYMLISLLSNQCQRTLQQPYSLWGFVQPQTDAQGQRWFDVALTRLFMFAVQTSSDWNDRDGFYLKDVESSDLCCHHMFTVCKNRADTGTMLGWLQVWMCDRREESGPYGNMGSAESIAFYIQECQTPFHLGPN